MVKSEAVASIGLLLRISFNSWLKLLLLFPLGSIGNCIFRVLVKLFQALSHLCSESDFIQLSWSLLEMNHCGLRVAY